MPIPTRTKLGEVCRTSKLEGRLKADDETEQGPLKPESLRHGAARAAGTRRSGRRDRETMTNCTGNQMGGQRKDSRQEVKG